MPLLFLDRAFAVAARKSTHSCQDSAVVSRRTVLSAFVSAGLSAACRRAAPSADQPPPDIDPLAERYVRLALKLAQHQPSLIETYLGPAEWRPGPRVPVAGLLDEVVALDDALSRLAADGSSDMVRRDRVRYLAGQVRGLRTVARRLSGETMRFADEARDAFGIEWPAQSSDAVRSARAELEARLQGKGPLAARYAAFRRRHALAGGQVLPVFRAAMTVCRARTAAHVPLPEDDGLTVERLESGGFEARAIYDGAYHTHVTLASAGPTDLARLVWLAAHEACPGHHLQHVLADRDLVRAKGWNERRLLPAFGPHVLVAEGAAEAGAALLLDGDAFLEVCSSLPREARTPEAAIPDLVAVHRAVAELDESVALVAQAYLDGETGTEAATERLREEALVPEPAALLAVIERQRTRVLAYPAGRRLIARHVRGGSAGDRWSRLAAIATFMTAPVGPE
jgi:hypothetical protein